MIDENECGGVWKLAHGLKFRTSSVNIDVGSSLAPDLRKISYHNKLFHPTQKLHGEGLFTAFGALQVAEFSVPHTAKIATFDHRDKLIFSSQYFQKQRKPISKGWIQRKAVISVIHGVWFKQSGLRKFQSSSVNTNPIGLITESTSSGASFVFHANSNDFGQSLFNVNKL